ncbi:MAG: hypothetical protein EPN69_06460 [Rhodanobacter sp.]|nr:MAG: hypothetical protein EPN69_06460 [Rhodanobacter sp.]TAM03472.1 MAG: hypothetical protein EPN71_03760 [Rhodanobacter sp.]TAM38764.1 MAG: hypothetical protein EPN58_15630 [Rhodanobacter sp.]
MAQQPITLIGGGLVGVRPHFGHPLVDADLHRQRIRLADTDGAEREAAAGLLIGADGAGSALRATPRVADVDLDAAVQLLQSSLPPLPALRHG